MPEEELRRSNTRMRFPEISPRAYEHPVDRGALGTLRSVPGFAEVVRSVSGFFAERGERMMALSSSIRVGPRQYPLLHRLRQECADTLDLRRVPALFVSRSPHIEAHAIGMDEPFITLSTGLVERLDTEGLRFVIGHEMGHILSGHAVYRTLLTRLLNMQISWGWMPVSALGLRAVIAALLEWYRKAELSCDRAGLLCGQDPAAALRVHVMLAGGIDPEQVDLQSFLAQAAEYDNTEDIRDSIHKLRNVEHMSHPFAVVRADQLQRWSASEEYREILAGNYPRRGDDAPRSDWTGDIGGAARSYRDSVSSSGDPLAKVVTDVGGIVSGAAGKLRERWTGRASGTGDGGSGDASPGGGSGPGGSGSGQGDTGEDSSGEGSSGEGSSGEDSGPGRHSGSSGPAGPR